MVGFGGEVVAGEMAQKLAYDCNLLAALGIRLVLVHGARPQIDAEMARRGLESRFHNGLRVTDEDALECVKSAMAVTRLEIEALLSQGLPNTPMAGSYMRVTGGNFITAKPVGVVDGVDLLFTGAVRKIIAEEIAADLDQQNVVLISPWASLPPVRFSICRSRRSPRQWRFPKGRKAALFVRCARPARRRRAAPRLRHGRRGGADARRRPWPDRGSRPLPAMRHSGGAPGCREVHLIDRDKDGGLLLEFFTHQGVGTLVSRDPLFRLREATHEDVGALVSLISPLEADGTLVRRGRELLEQEIERFTLVEHDGVLVGCAALYRFSEERAAELACLAVQPEFRRAGLGELLLKRIEKRARAAELERLFVLTTRTAHWFRERGFEETGPDQLPTLKRELYNLQRRSKVLVKRL